MLWRTIRLGWFLAVRYVRRSSVWTTLLIVFIMVLTFLNVVTVRGILVGLPIGAQKTYRQQYAGDILIKPKTDYRYIERTRYIERIISATPGYVSHTTRFTSPGVLEANYREPRKPIVLPDTAAAEVVGIDPEQEDTVTHISSFIVEGKMLTPDDRDGILLGYQLLDRYANSLSQGATVKNVSIGDKVRLTIGGIRGEYTLRGVVRTKVGENHRRAYLLAGEMRKVLGRFDYNAGEIAVVVDPSIGTERFKRELLAAGVGAYANVQTALESQGQFLEDITATFATLSNIIGAIGIAVAVVTVFIVIFIFAITRQKQIGILKGIGIHPFAIEVSYILLALFYAVAGTFIGMFLLYQFIAPYMDAHPIDFPFSDGVLVIPLDVTLERAGIILLATVIAGYIPARMIVGRNTINAILGR